MNKSDLIISVSPHITKPRNTTRLTMLHVLISLLPVTAAATYFFGYMVIINVFFCVVFCTGLEMLYNIIVKNRWSRKGLKTNSAWNLAPAVTGVILALNLPTYLDIWGFNIVSGGRVIISFDMIIACFLGSLVAIVMVKMLFGGIGKNFANPAAVGRIFLFVAFSTAFSSIYKGSDGIVAITSATWLGDKSTTVPLLDMVMGKTGTAAVGETSAIAIVIGYLYLSIVRVIDFRIPLIVVATTLVFTLFFDGWLKYIIHNAMDSAEQIVNPLKTLKDYALFMGRHALSGGLLFGAVFMATDYSSSPNTFFGRVFFCVGIGFFTAVMRTWTSMPEGISFAIVIMNIASPLINRMTKRKFFGVDKNKKSKKSEKSEVRL